MSALEPSHNPSEEVQFIIDSFLKLTPEQQLEAGKLIDPLLLSARLEIHERRNGELSAAEMGSVDRSQFPLLLDVIDVSKNYPSGASRYYFTRLYEMAERCASWGTEKQIKEAGLPDRIYEIRDRVTGETFSEDSVLIGYWLVWNISEEQTLAEIYLYPNNLVTNKKDFLDLLMTQFPDSFGEDGPDGGVLSSIPKNPDPRGPSLALEIPTSNNGEPSLTIGISPAVVAS